MAVLRRLGSKERIAEYILPLFPAHELYIELFFGAGGLFFSKPLAKYNIVNDIDDDVFNFFMTIKNKKDEFLNTLKKTPISESLFKYWDRNVEQADVWRAVRFFFLSNLGWLGLNKTMRFSIDNSKEVFEVNINKIFSHLENVQIMSTSYENVLKKISFRHKKDLDRSFIYADPPYLDTTNNYRNGFTKNDFINLLNYLQNSNIKFAVSEFDNKFVINEAQKRGLKVNYIKKKQTLKNRNTEILITNYKTNDRIF